jgi:hypothetical protein
MSSDTILSGSRTCGKAIDDIETTDSIFTAKASVCIASGVCSYGQTTVRPYIGVDFGQTVSVTSVKILNIWDGWSPKDFNIFIGDSTTIENNNLCTTGGSYNSGSVERTFTCGNVLYGRYIFIQQGLHDDN